MSSRPASCLVLQFRPGAPQIFPVPPWFYRGPPQTRRGNIRLIKCCPNVSPLTYLYGLVRVCTNRALLTWALSKKKYVPGVLILIVQFVREINHVHPALFNNANDAKKHDESKIENYTFEFYRRREAPGPTVGGLGLLKSLNCVFIFV